MFSSTPPKDVRLTVDTIKQIKDNGMDYPCGLEIKSQHTKQREECGYFCGYEVHKKNQLSSDYWYESSKKEAVASYYAEHLVFYIYEWLEMEFSLIENSLKTPQKPLSIDIKTRIAERLLKDTDIHSKISNLDSLSPNEVFKIYSDLKDEYGLPVLGFKEYFMKNVAHQKNIRLDINAFIVNNIKTAFLDNSVPHLSTFFEKAFDSQKSLYSSPDFTYIKNEDDTWSITRFIPSQLNNQHTTLQIQIQATINPNNKESFSFSTPLGKISDINKQALTLLRYNAEFAPHGLTITVDDLGNLSAIGQQIIYNSDIERIRSYLKNFCNLVINVVPQLNNLSGFTAHETFSCHEFKTIALSLKPKPSSSSSLPPSQPPTKTTDVNSDSDTDPEELNMEDITNDPDELTKLLKSVRIN